LKPLNAKPLKSKAVPVAARLEKLLAEALGRAGCSGVNAGIVVGVSGGPDSCALLYALHRLSAVHQLRLHVAHLNHDFRGEEAEEDARFVAARAGELGLPVTVEKQDPIEYQRERRISSFEQAAREMRYRFLSDTARSVGAGLVAVGHTADDLAETVLEHILRGSGISGLRGMTELAPWPWPTDVLDVTLFRPLLRATKEDAATYCRELGQTYREDSGNFLFRFTRNRVRHQLLPLLAAEYNPQVRDALVRLSSSASLDLDYLDREADLVWALVVGFPDRDNAGSVEFYRHALAGLHPALQRRLLRRGYAQLAGDTRRLRESHLSAMSALVQEPGAGRSLSLPGGLYFHEVQLGMIPGGEPGDRLVISRESRPPCPLPPLEGEFLIDLSGWEEGLVVAEVGGWRVSAGKGVGRRAAPGGKGRDELAARFNPAALGNEVVVRARQPGDRFQPLGMEGEKKLQDFFTDARVPRAWRDRVPLLVAGGRIAWVVGYRTAQWVRLRTTEGEDAPEIEISFEQL
jgi:tRNA(Ile)-lysidine synthase